MRLHDVKGLEDFNVKIQNDVNSFMEFSRKKAKDAQAREVVTRQPKESLSTLTKAKITITNYLGGMYFLTVDEISFTDQNTILLIESKHSKTAFLPSIGDIKDGLIRMVLFTNLKEITVDDKSLEYKPILQLTSAKLTGSVNTYSKQKEIEDFMEENKFTYKQIKFLENLFLESKNNNFTIILKKG